MTNEVYKYRKAMKLTQEDLAKMVGVTRQTIISIEQGKYIASLPLALKIARVFNVPVESIFIMEEGE
ncbi:TPA: helix-turn-helix transcriptional regulator [Candidatus Avacholeplasma faecigallinarum]|nr:helix-turn-helix transcriptional regulator [Candidatus Avacholeplasma faecigallinarum]